MVVWHLLIQLYTLLTLHFHARISNDTGCEFNFVGNSYQPQASKSSFLHNTTCERTKISKFLRTVTSTKSLIRWLFTSSYLICSLTLTLNTKANLRNALKGKMGTAVAQWLRRCATNRKLAGSIPAGVNGIIIDIKSFRSHYGPRVDSASNRNEYQEYFLG